MSIVHPTHVNPIVNPLVGILNVPAWRAGGSSYPPGLPSLGHGEYFLTDEHGNYLTDENGNYLTGKDSA